MKKYLLFVFILFAAAVLYPQDDKAALNLGTGSYFYNSENGLNMMDMADKEFRFYYVIGASYQTSRFFGLNLQIEYSFDQILKKDVFTFVRTSSASPEPIGTFGGNAILTNHTFEIDYVSSLGEYFQWGIGPSFVITHRTIDLDVPPYEGENFDPYIYDRLVSSGLGANAFIEFNTPPGEEGLYFTAKLEYRYTHSIWFDEGLRKLDNYSQEFFTANLTVGAGYAF